MGVTQLSVRRILVLLASLSTVLLSVGPLARPAAAAGTDASSPTVTGVPCGGNVDTLSWAPPTNPIGPVTGYQVLEGFTGPSGLPGSATFNVAADQTSLQFPVEVGFDSFGVSYQTQVPNPPGPPQTVYEPFTSVGFTGETKPSPIPWDFFGNLPSMAGNGSVTVSFYWDPEDINGIDGFDNNDMVTVTAAPGGQSITSTVQGSQGAGFGVTDTFTGLVNGVGYTFYSVASNVCGSSGQLASPVFTPVGAPVLTCVVTSTKYPPAVKKAQQKVRVQSTYGLAAIDDISVSNGTVKVPKFTVGTKEPVVVTATKTKQSQPTNWSFSITDVNNNTQFCT